MDIQQIENLRDEYLAANDGNIEDALLAACGRLIQAAHDVAMLECASSHGFLRGHLNNELSTKK